MRDNPTHRGGKRGDRLLKARSLGLMVLLLILAVQVTSACTGPSVNEQENAGAEQEETSQVQSVQQIIDESETFYADRVSVSGEVTEIITPVAFEMGGEMDEFNDSTRYGEGADGLLIVNDTGEAPAPQVDVGQTVEVSGTVREFQIEEVESQIGTDLADGVFTYWADEPVLIATSIEQQGGQTTQ